MIKPTVGRIVYFWDYGRDPNDESQQPEAALVTFVWSDSMVNLCVFDSNGFPRSATSVELCQPEDTRPFGGGFCEWMPYQKAQAAQRGMPISPEERENMVKQAMPFRDDVAGD